jgi:hypothetical protein
MEENDGSAGYRAAQPHLSPPRENQAPRISALNLKTAVAMADFVLVA